MSEGMSYREINDHKEAQHGFGHLAKKKKKLANKMLPGASHEKDTTSFAHRTDPTSKFKTYRDWKKAVDSKRIMPHTKQ